MSMTDPIADMLTRIRNALIVTYSTVDIPSSRQKIDIAKVLKSEGFIKNYKIIADKRQGIMRIFFKYDEKGESVIVGLKRVSKPGLRIYVERGEMPRVYGGLGIAILSTSKGIMTGQKAWRLGLGGELVGYVW